MLVCEDACYNMTATIAVDGAQIIFVAPRCRRADLARQDGVPAPQEAGGPPHPRIADEHGVRHAHEPRARGRQDVPGGSFVSDRRATCAATLG